MSLAETISQTGTMAWRATMKMRRNFEQLFDVTIQPLLFTAMFAYIFGGAISGSVKDYLPIIITGLIGQTVLTACVATGVQLREDMDKGVFDRFKVLPIARIAPLAGPMVADLIRYAIASTLTFATGIAMGYRPGGGVLGVLGAILLAMVAGWSLAWIFTWFGTIGKTAQGVQGISLMVMFPLTFLSNAFVPTDTMPSWLRRLRRRQPGQPRHLGHPRPRQRRRGDGPGRLGAARLRGGHRDLRPAVGAQLQPQDVTRTGPRHTRRWHDPAQVPWTGCTRLRRRFRAVAQQAQHRVGHEVRPGPLGILREELVEPAGPRLVGQRGQRLPGQRGQRAVVGPAVPDRHQPQRLVEGRRVAVAQPPGADRDQRARRSGAGPRSAGWRRPGRAPGRAAGRRSSSARGSGPGGAWRTWAPRAPLAAISTHGVSVPGQPGTSTSTSARARS